MHQTCHACCQGDLYWDRHQTGNPSQDWPLLQRVSCQNPEVFWSAIIKALGITFSVPPERILHEEPNPDNCVWLPGARLNIADCALRCPLAVADAPAVLWAEEQAPKQVQHMTLEVLREKAAHIAACLATRFNPGTCRVLMLPRNRSTPCTSCCCCMWIAVCIREMFVHWKY